MLLQDIRRLLVAAFDVGDQKVSVAWPWQRKLNRRWVLCQTALQRYSSLCNISRRGSHRAIEIIVSCISCGEQRRAVTTMKMKENAVLCVQQEGIGLRKR